MDANPNPVSKSDVSALVALDRDVFDHADTESHTYKASPGLSEELVREISKQKNEPAWMLELRLKGLHYFLRTPTPAWGPNLDKLKFDEIIYFARPDAKQNAKNWEEVPPEIKKTFDRLGIPKAEQQWLAGTGAQYDSDVIYHKIRDDLAAKGVIFEDMDVALHKYPELVKQYFMTNCIPVTDHKFIMLHAAVWSGGTFIFVPKHVKVDLPLQAYFRMNAKKGGQFEHTLIIIEEGAQLHYIEGCFTKGTLVQSNPNYKPIEEIKTGDKVMTDSGEYKKVYSTQVTPYSGELYTIKVYGDSTQSIEVTAGHPILSVKRKRKTDRNKEWNKSWMIPKYLEKQDYLTIPINKTIVSNLSRAYEIEQGVGRHKPKIYQKEVPLSPEFFKLIGYYLAEGSISGNEGDHYVNFSFNENERKYIDETKQLLKEVFGYTKAIETQHPKNHGTNVVVSSVDLVQIFKEFGKGSSNKVIPHWVLLESPEKQKGLLTALFRGDGNYYNKKHKSGFKETFRISTTSEKMARQVREILLRVKIPAFLNKQLRAAPKKPMYTVGVTGEYMSQFGIMVGIPVSNKLDGKKRASMFYIDDNFLYAPIRSISKKEVVDVPVYDISVEDLHTYVAGGATVHNCSAPQYTANSLHAGCVEIYVKKDARMRYSSVENWSKNTYNLNTKRGIVEENALLEWVSAQTGSGVTMLYPCSILKGRNAKADHISIAVAGKGQDQDTGAKVYHLAPNTSSVIRAKSISKDGGISTFRGHVKVIKGAKDAKVSVKCDALMVDEISISNTFPYMKIMESQVDVAHEATVGKIDAEQLFYLMSRGLTEEQATQMVVAGFIEPIVKELPLEYAVELNRLIELEMESHDAGN